MNFAFDIDGTISAAPKEFAAIMKALRASGHDVHVLTGTMDQEVTSEHYERRFRQLRDLGVVYDKLAIVTNPPLTAKADYCRKHNIDMLFEDSRQWAEPCAGVCTVLLMM